VGGTSGIGENTAREFVRYASQPHIYIVGRNASHADSLKTEFHELNSETKVQFIQSDVSLLKNVDKVCDEIKANENKINLLVLSQGIMTTKHEETSEGLDKKFSLHYYSRLRFTENLLPLLKKAGSSEQKSPARVISVLGAGLETSLNTNDLALKSNYGVRACADHAITMNTMAFEQLATDNKDVVFIHSQPGGVAGTNIGRELPGFISTLMNGITNIGIFKPWLMSAKESGERQVWSATVASLTSGKAILLGPKNEPTGNVNKLIKLKEDGTQEKIWKHTMGVFEKICENDEKY